MESKDLRKNLSQTQKISIVGKESKNQARDILLAVNNALVEKANILTYYRKQFPDIRLYYTLLRRCCQVLKRR